jgi:hypothetical protein
VVVVVAVVVADVLHITDRQSGSRESNPGPNIDVVELVPTELTTTCQM